MADAPLEALQRLLTGFAIRHLLAVVTTAPSVQPGLAGGYHVQSLVELAVAGQREPVAPPPRLRPPPAPCQRRRRSSGPWGREAHHVADRPHDPRGQYGTYAEDLVKGGVGSFHLGFDAPIQVGDLPIQRPDSKRSTSEANRRLRLAEAPRGRMPRRMRAARGAESVPATPPGTRSRRSPWRRLSARVRSATRSSRLSERSRST